MDKKYTIAIAGNPNSGKTTLFNGLTGGKQQIGNWPGVTVEKKEGLLEYRGKTVSIVDLPGIYSLSADSEDEKVARDFLCSSSPDLIINVIDSTNIERNLYLTTQLIEIDVPLVIVLNMYDLALKKNIKIEIDHFQKHLGVPVLPVNAKNPKDLEKLKALIGEAAGIHPRSGLRVSYHNEMENLISEWSPALAPVAAKIGVNPRWIAIKLMEQDNWVLEKTEENTSLPVSEIRNGIARIAAILKDDLDVLIADAKYGTIHGICRDTISRQESRHSRTEKIDAVVMHKYFGIPIFLVVMYLVFWFTISIGGAFIDFFDILTGAIFVDGLGWLLNLLHSPAWLVNILAGGVGAGIQTVSTFIPVIFCMFFVLSLLEDSGYMARAAFVMDKFLRGIGLPGKAFVPMLVGFGCTVPAIMGARTLENRKDRFMTIFITPFMSCGARLPVYALFGAALFPAHAGLIVFALYFTGIILAVGTGLLLKNTLFRGEVSHFVMELPPYHSPRMRHILLHTWHRLRGFVIRAGKVIIGAVLVLTFFNTLGTDGSFGNEDTEKSVLTSLGKAVTPVLSPMGVEQDNWPATVGLCTGMFAKESIVGTLTSLYSQNSLSRETCIQAETNSAETKAHPDFRILHSFRNAFASIAHGLGGVINSIIDPLGVNVIQHKDGSADAEKARLFILMRQKFSPAAGFAYLLFVLIYFPCFAALGAAFREMGPLYTIIQTVYLTLLAWIIATLFFQITSGGSIAFIAVCLALLVLCAVFFRIMGNKKKPG
ncbi:MAG: Fe(2+) transporter permease subunit FeoB [Spirochaetales bacterium]|nr:Fe(2+) transporter permease subunit FeoB [Spirochaetales bacterium]